MAQLSSIGLRFPATLRPRVYTRWAVLVFLSVTVIACAGQSAGGVVKDGVWQLVWSDEFNGPNDSHVDTSKWIVETGGEGWGNEELQTYGRFEARIKVPAGQGMWPAFWMLGADIDKAGWPACGEVDIMENIGKEPSIVHGSIHGPGYTGTVGIEAPYSLPGTEHFADDFHIFAVEWSPGAVLFYVDKDLYVSHTRSDLRPGWKWVFDKPFFLILNLAVGGDWPGNPDASTVFPNDMLVDYVRVYQRKEEPKK
jgi:beta-glucanase (GH16 family)